MDYLLQSARGDYVPMLDLTAERHAAFAERHSLELIVHRGAVLPDWNGTWDSVPLMLELVRRPDTGLVMYLDADTLIVGDGDPREALGECVIGMTRHPGPPEHYNCGMMLVRAGAQVATVLQRMLDNGPGEYPWWEQTILNKLLTEPEWTGQVKTLPHEWNSTVVLTHPERCIVRAWHGYPGGVGARLAQMELAIAKL